MIRILKEDSNLKDFNEIMNRYGIENDIVSSDEIDHYYTVLQNSDEVARYNFQGDYWGSDEEYESDNMWLAEVIECYVDKEFLVKKEYDDTQYKGVLVGIAIDDQYNSLAHTDIVFDNLVPVDTAE